MHSVYYDGRHHGLWSRWRSWNCSRLCWRTLWRAAQDGSYKEYRTVGLRFENIIVTVLLRQAMTMGASFAMIMSVAQGLRGCLNS